MKSFIGLLSWLLLFHSHSIAQSDAEQAIIDSANSTFTYETGVVFIGDNKVRLTVPKGFYYLNSEQSRRVLVDLWGNPEDVATLGMVFPAGHGPFTRKSWAFTINYETIGHINDEDADGLNYDYLLNDIAEDTDAKNQERTINGHQPVRLIGWASPPVYDRNRHVLEWAEEFKADDSAGANGLRYDVRILGRRGVLSLNAVTDVSQLPVIKQYLPAIIGSISFERGHRYVDFEPATDQVAVVDAGGLVTGKLPVKTGMLVMLADFWKVLLLVAIGGAAIQRFLAHQLPDEEPA